MKKILVTMMAFVLTIGAQAQRDTIGVSKFTAIYRYECKTTDADGQPVTDSMYIAVQTSGGITKSFPYEEYDRQKISDQKKQKRKKQKTENRKTPPRTQWRLFQNT